MTVSDGFEPATVGPQVRREIERLPATLTRALTRGQVGLPSELGDDVELEIVGLGEVDALLEVAMVHADLPTRPGVGQ